MLINILNRGTLGDSPLILDSLEFLSGKPSPSIVMIRWGGGHILAKSKKRLPYILFGIMGLLLVFGDAFHLVPRIINALEPGVQNIDYYLGIGKLITSITMTIFYVILFWFFKLRYKEKTSLALDFGIYVLAITRIALCLLPFNEWTSKEAPYMWGIYRNIPFVVIGIIMVVLTFIWTRANKDKPFMFVHLAIFLSFIFYIMTVTLTVVHTAFGMMMIPKTVCYVWLLVMGVMAIKKDNKNGEE